MLVRTMLLGGLLLANNVHETWQLPHSEESFHQMTNASSSDVVIIPWFFNISMTLVFSPKRNITRFSSSSRHLPLHIGSFVDQMLGMIHLPPLPHFIMLQYNMTSLRLAPALFDRQYLQLVYSASRVLVWSLFKIPRNLAA